MKRVIISLTLVLIFLSAGAQSYYQFKRDFKNLENPNLSRKELSDFGQKYPEYFPSSLFDTIPSYPLKMLVNERIYKKEIPKLLQSPNLNHRLAAYQIIMSAGDKTFEPILIKRLKEEKGGFNQLLITLMYLRTTRTTEFFDAMIENDTLISNWAVASTILMLDKDSLRRTAYSRINSNDPKVRSQAAGLLGYTKLDIQTEEVLKNAATTWDWKIKSFPIYALNRLKAPHLLPVMRPLLDSLKGGEKKLLSSYIYSALAESPSEEDRLFLGDFAVNSDSASMELLNALLNSKDIDNTKLCLRLLCTKPIGRYPNFNSSSQLKSDSILPELQRAARQIKNPEILFWLINNLEERKDTVSTNILIHFLRSKWSQVRSAAARALKGNPSSELNSLLPELIKDPSLRDLSFTQLAIDNGMNNLHSIYERILEQTATESEGDEMWWHSNALHYLSTFPQKNYVQMFRKILSKNGTNMLSSQEKRDAALGLGRLKDVESVDLIIVASWQDEAKDFYLNALEMIKGSKAKAEIEKHKQGNYKELVDRILRNW